MEMCHLKKYIFEAISPTDAVEPQCQPILTESMFKLHMIYTISGVMCC